MNTKLLAWPFVFVLAAVCVSKSTVQGMIETNNTSVINPRIATLESRIGESQRLSEQQRMVLIRHFELLGEMSSKALTQLREIP